MRDAPCRGKRIAKRRRPSLRNVAVRRSLRVATVSLVSSQQRLENFFQRAASAKDAGLHRAHAAVKDFRNFLVAESFEVAQNHRNAKNIGNLLQRALHGHLNFLRRELLERSGGEILDFDPGLTLFRLGIDGNIFLQMTLEPTLVIQRFANRDAVEPSFQRAALAETANAAKGFQKNFLGAIGGVGRISEHAEDEVIDRRMIVRDEPVEDRLRAGLQLMDEFGFIAAPRKGTSPIGHCRPFRPDSTLSPARKSYSGHPAAVQFRSGFVSTNPEPGLLTVYKYKP